MAAPDRTQTQELLDEESLAVLAILPAVSLEFGFGFAKTAVWWAGLIAGPLAMLVLVTLFRARPTRRLLVGLARLVASGERRGDALGGTGTARSADDPPAPRAATRAAEVGGSTGPAARGDRLV